MQINNEITLAELSFPSQFVVWAARQWIRIRDPGEPDAQRLCDAFERVGALQALASLDGVLGLLATSARRRLDFRSRCDIVLGHDEYHLIQVIDALQLEPVDPVQCESGVVANQIVTDWVRRSHWLQLQAHLAELAVRLGAAGLWVRCRLADRPRYPVTSFH